MKLFIKWLYLFIIIVHLTNGSGVFLDGTSMQVKETQDTIASRRLWLEIYNLSQVVAVFSMEQVIYAEIVK